VLVFQSFGSIGLGGHARHCDCDVLLFLLESPLPAGLLECGLAGSIFSANTTSADTKREGESQLRSLLPPPTNATFECGNSAEFGS